MATYVDGDYSRAVPVVASFYTIRDSQRHPTEDAVRFLIAESDVYATFPKLLGELAKLGMIATAKRTKYVSRLMPTLSSATSSVDNAVIVTVSKIYKLKKGRRMFWLPAILFFATLATVFIDGLIRSQDEFATAFIQDPLLLAAVYTMSLLGILGVHEMGHMIAAKHHGIRASWPYFIPGIPGFTFVPTFGAMIQIRSSMTNRNVLFDVGIAGPIAGLLVTIIVSIYGSYISVMVPGGQVEAGVELHSSILMMATLELTGNGAATGDSVLVASPVLFAAWVGFLITFLNLLPAWQLDGGHITRSALGVRTHRILTFASIGILVILNYLMMALLVLFFASRAPASTPLDDVSPLSKKRKALFWVAIALAVLCAAPFPGAFIPWF
ncbi:site-2 protease family protein [Candidatus Nitrososphaera sp. FF02]|uniref:site-2 protease family protein n=1 Tax=Candidatus Nitrososphaera sp. FF02 TaxID=3398226 RepID=UPI0039EB1DBE